MKLDHSYTLPVVGLLLVLAPSLARAADLQPVPPEVQAAVKSLEKSDDATREKAYGVIADKGDARLIPVLVAYRDGRLQNRQGTLAIYGGGVQTPGKATAYPLLDAYDTRKQLAGPDGKPLFADEIDLSAPGMMRLPPAKRAERTVIAELISSLSLLDPDPDIRKQSIREAGERAARAFVDPAESARLLSTLSAAESAFKARLAAPANPAGPVPAAELAALGEAVKAIDAAAAEKPTKLLTPAPGPAATGNVRAALAKLRATFGPAQPPAPSAPPADPAYEAYRKTIDDAARVVNDYQDRLDGQKKALDELPKFSAALKKQLEREPTGPFAADLHEAAAGLDVVLGDRPAILEGIRVLGATRTSRAENILTKLLDSARAVGDKELQDAAAPALSATEGYQTRIRFVKQTFDGLSQSSILILLALGLSIVFGLMGVINMAHGEFMMVGAFTTYGVSYLFQTYLPASAFNYYPIVAIPASFLVAALVGLLVEFLVIRHLYGRPLETLLATWGIGLILVQLARVNFGDNLSVKPPEWMIGGAEVARDLVLPLNRIYIIAYCAVCIVTTWFVVNKTKLGLLLRATTQNRDMAAALGIPTRRVDAMTFAFGAGLAGLAGFAVPMFDKINPGMGQSYVVDSFLVVVVGGVGKLAGAIWAGLGLGFLGKYLEPLLGYFAVLRSSSSIIGQVVLLALVVGFLQWKPSGLFPPKGRLADA